jgi:NADH-quinone oxidoreductase subunit M
VVSLQLWIRFDVTQPNFQFVETFQWGDVANYGVSFGVDGLSLFLILLTTLLVPLCLLASWNNVQVRVKEYVMAFLAMEFMLLVVFTILNLLGFYVAFESVLIPMFLIIGIWGSRARKIRAGYLFFFYTLIGSVLMLLGILYLYSVSGSFDYATLLRLNLEPEVQRWLFIAFFASFAAKVPMVPMHIWLPEAHVEAPTAGSVILAGVLLKLGFYGLARFSIPLFPEASVYFAPLVFTMAAIGVVYASLTAMRQSDLKRIVAYSSVAHMGVGIVGLFALNAQGIEGSLFLMLAHGVVSSALFLCVGVVYDRYHSRMVSYYSGLAHIMPLYAIVFLVFTLANIALPGTANFIGEFLCFIGAFQANVTITVLAATGMVLGGGYSLWLYNRVAFGNLKVQYFTTKGDLTWHEVIVFAPLVVLTIWMGVAPDVFLAPMHASVGALLTPVQSVLGA